MSTNHQQTVYIFSCTLILKTLKKTRKTVYIFSWTEDEEEEERGASRLETATAAAGTREAAVSLFKC